MPALSARYGMSPCIGTSKAARCSHARNWKAVGDDGGGVLGIFISHCFHYLEWFCGRIVGLSARIAGLSAGGEMETTVAMAMLFEAGPLCSLSMSCASYLGIGHRIEFFGEDGTLVLHNPGADYMRGFELCYAKPLAEPLRRIVVTDPDDARYPDGRIAPVSRLAKIFFNAIESGGAPSPGFAEGYRVQRLMDAARRSHNQGVWIDVAAGDASQENARPGRPDSSRR